MRAFATPRSKLKVRPSAALLELLKVPRALLLLPLLLRRPVRLLRGVALRRDAP
jgi:hypothetical protein